MMIEGKETGSEARTIRIYRDGEQQEPPVYYHWPLFSFIDRKDPIPGFPGIVHHVSEPDDAGTIAIEFLVQLTSTNFQEECRYVIPRGAAEKLRVDAWPMTHAFVKCFNRDWPKDELAFESLPTLTSLSEQLPVVMHFGPNELSRFLDAARKDRLAFEWSVQYFGRPVRAGNVKIEGSRDIQSAIREVLTSKQLANTAPILQAQANEILRLASVNLKKVIRANHPDVLPLLQTTGLNGQIFEPARELSMDELRKESSETSKQLATYLRPHLETLKMSEAREGRTVEVKETETTQKLSGKHDVGVSLKFVSGSQSVSLENINRALDRLEKATGVKFETNGTSEWYRPHQIRIANLRKGWEKVQFREETAVFLLMDAEFNYVNDTPVNSWFSQSLVNTEISRRRGNRDEAAEKERLVHLYLEKLQQGRADKWKAIATPKNEKWRNGVTLTHPKEVEMDLVAGEPEFRISFSWFGRTLSVPDGFYLIKDLDPAAKGVTSVVNSKDQKNTPSGDGVVGLGPVYPAQAGKIVCRGRTYEVVVSQSEEFARAKGPDGKPKRIKIINSTTEVFDFELTKPPTIIVRGIDPVILVAETPPPDWEPVRSIDEIRKLSIAELRNATK